MNRRSFIRNLAGALVTINLTLGFRPATTAPEKRKPEVDAYRLVRLFIYMTALEDLKLGDVVTRKVDYEGEGVSLARMDDPIFGVAEAFVRKGMKVPVCTCGVALVHTFGSVSVGEA